MRKIVVLPYNPEWADMFKVEASRITAFLGKEVQEIHHIGSTAIPSITAKPIIDILVVVHDINKIDKYNQVMINQGYIPMGEYGIPRRRFFIKGSDSNRTYHVHIFQTGDANIERHLNFRDYLIAHPEEAKAYSHLKEQLAKNFAEDIEGYMGGKSSFIKEIDRKARDCRNISIHQWNKKE